MTEMGERAARLSEELAAELRAEVAARELPGLSVLVSDVGGPVFEFMHGSRTPDGAEPIDRDTVFGVASITKSVAAVAVLALEERGVLATYDLVTRWLPGLVLPGAAEERLRIGHLLSHTAGFPGLPLVNGARTPSIEADPDRDRLDSPPVERDHAGIRTAADLVTALGRTEYVPLGEPGEVFSYSNEGYGLVHAVVEAATGRRFADVVAAHVLTPLGVTRAGFTVDDLRGLDNVAALYAPLRDAAAPYSPSPHWWDVGGIHANGSLKISAADLAVIVRMLCAGRRAADTGTRTAATVLSAGSVRRMTTPYAVLPDGSSYGLGVELGSYGDRPWFGHGGSVKGVSSSYRCVPGDGLSVVVLINASDADAAAIADLVTRRLLAVPDEPLPPPAPVPNAAEYAGRYRSAEQQELSVSADGDALRLDATGAVLRPLGPDLFVDDRRRRYAFLRRDGAVDRVFCGKRVLPRLATGGGTRPAAAPAAAR